MFWFSKAQRQMMLKKLETSCNSVSPWVYIFFFQLERHHNNHLKRGTSDVSEQKEISLCKGNGTTEVQENPGNAK